jgi:signal transduction histidine kinase
MPFNSLGLSLCTGETPWFLGIFDLSTAPPLLYYSYIPIVIATLLVGCFVFLNNRRSLEGKLLLSVSMIFSLWVINILVQWTASYHSVLMFAWQLTSFIEISLYLCIAYFAYVFSFKQDLPFLVKILFTAILLIVLTITPTTLNVENYDIVNCQGNNGIAWTYFYALESIIILFTVLFCIYAIRHETNTLHKRRIQILGTAIALLESIFFTSNYYGELTKIYEFNLWGPVGMFFFVILVGYMIVVLQAFNVKLLGAQALVTATILLIGSEYFFVQNATSYTLVSVTLLFTFVFGWLLVRSVKKEVEQRQQIELLAKNLEQANDAQVILIHFITHQIKGFVAKSRNIFSMALEGDFGPVGPELKPMLQAGFDSDTKGAGVIQEILNAANIKSGKVSYTMESFDLRPLIEDMINYHNTAAKEKGVSIKANLGTEPARVLGDRAQLMNVFKNIIDNSIKYTPKGEVNISLTSKPEKKVVLFAIKDTGVGITPEYMQNLFTEGGHGKDSIKVNVESTGFGLYIVKQIVDAHKGRVWAESEGAGKGTQFYIELPSA